MPYEAREGSKSGPIVKACNCKITDMKKIYYCKTDGCNAFMSIVNAGNVEEAYFRRKPSSPHHINANCVRCGIVFDRSKYDETKFSKVNAFKWLFNKSELTHKGNTGSRRGKVGGGNIGLRSLGRIYDMCVTLGKSNSYNGELINDLFADEENYSKYRRNLNGCLIVECSYYKKVYNEAAILFNYPTNFRIAHDVIKVKFEDEEMCWQQFNKLKKCHHTEPIAIAGDWKVVFGNSEYQAECTIYSGRQIYYVK